MRASDLVVHLITKLELGGAQKITLRTVRHLDRTKYEPVLLAGDEPGVLDEDMRELSDVGFYRVPYLRRAINPVLDLFALLALFRLFRTLRPRLVHTHSSKAGILGRWAAWLAAVPVIVHTVHGFGFTPEQSRVKRRALTWLERQSARITHWTFTDSEANRTQGIKLGLFSAGTSSRLPPGIDQDRLRAVRVNRVEMRLVLGLDPVRPVVGMVAPFKPQKAPVDFVRVASIVHRARPDAQFILIGDGELRPEIEREIERLQLGNAVHLLGWRRDVPELMCCMDMFVLTSRWEGLPRVYLEALTIGIPIVGTNVDGAPEVVLDGVNGFLRQSGDVQGLSEAVLWLLDHPVEARAMGEKGRSLSDQFDYREIVRQQELRYEALLAGVRASGSRRLRSHGTQPIQ